MDYLQYKILKVYKILFYFVLNLIINGLPSIFEFSSVNLAATLDGFKPYYKWITFNIYLK